MPLKFSVGNTFEGCLIRQEYAAYTKIFLLFYYQKIFMENIYSSLHVEFKSVFLRKITSYQMSAEIGS